MEEQYRIPTIDEFIQGFKFEVRRDYRFGFLNLEESTFDGGKEYSIWDLTEVWWGCNPDDVVTYNDADYKISLTGRTVNFFKPFDVESFLKQGLIRVKI